MTNPAPDSATAPKAPTKAARRTAADLTPQMHKVLHQLHFREAGAEEKPCWLVDLPRNVYLLVVPTMYGPYEGLHTYKGRPTLSRLHDRGFIAYGPDVRLPADIQRPYEAWARRTRSRCFKDWWGCTVTLTTAGRELCATIDGPISPMNGSAE